MTHKLIFILGLCVWAASCTKDKISTQEKAPEVIIKYINPSFAIREMQLGDTLEIYGKRALYLDIKYQMPRINYTLILDRDTTTTLYDRSYIIDPDSLDNKCHTLVVIPNIIEQGTGSGQDSQKQDTVYMISPSKAELRYVLKYVSIEDIKNTLKEGRTPDGYFCLSWKKPELKNAQISHYEISHSNLLYGHTITTTLDANQVSLVDSVYVFGKKAYSLKTYFTDKGIEPWESTIEVSTPHLSDSEITFEELPEQKLKISWTKPQYRACYKLILNPAYNSDDERIEKDLDYNTNYFITDAPAFPDARYVNINYHTDTKTQAKCGEISNTYNSAQVMQVRSDYELQATACFSYNRGNNNLYILRTANLDRRDLSLNINKTIMDNYLHYLYDDKITCSYDGSKIAIFKYIDFSDKKAWKNGFVVLNQDMTLLHNFQIPDSIKLQVQFPKFYSISIDNHNRVALLVDDTIYIFNIDNGSLIYSEALPTSPYHCHYVFSDDFKYICQYSTKNLKILKIGETGLTQIVSKDFAMLTKCLFDPTNSENLYITNEKQTQRISTRSGDGNSSVIQGVLECIDPVTGNVAYKDQTEGASRTLYIVSSDLQEQIVRFNICYNYDITDPHPNRKLSLYNNQLFAPTSSQVLYTDIAKYQF